MTKKNGATKLKSCRKNDFQAWNPEDMIKNIMNKPVATEEKWMEKF